jgi:hypothetical protein
VDISRKIIRQTEQDFFQLMVSSEEERRQNEHLHASNELFRHNLDRAEHVIENLESQLHAIDGGDSYVRACPIGLFQLEETLRLVERLQSKLRMQIEHDREMENVIPVYKEVFSEGRPLPDSETTQSIEMGAESNIA